MTDLYESNDDLYDEDRRAQDAVEDAKYDFPPKEEPDDWQQGEPTHYQHAEELLAEAADLHGRGDDECYALDAAAARATLAVADQLAKVVSLLKRERSPEPLAEHDVADRAWLDSNPFAAAVGVGSVSPTDPAALGEWLRGLPDGTIFRGAKGLGWQLNVVAVTSFLVAPYTFRALTSTAGEEFRIDIDVDLPALAFGAPFTVLALGAPQDQSDEPPRHQRTTQVAAVGTLLETLARPDGGDRDA
jgi:hypothetical protein